MGYGFFRSPASVRTSQTFLISCRTSGFIVTKSPANHSTKHIHDLEYVAIVFPHGKTTPQTRQTSTLPACAVALRQRGNHGRAGTRQARTSRQVQRIGLYADGAGSVAHELRLFGAATATTAITAISERRRPIW